MVLVLWTAVLASHFSLQIHDNQTLGAADRSTAPGSRSEITQSEQTKPRVQASSWYGSDRLPQLYPIALGIGDPPESPDPGHLLDFRIHVRTLGAQLREHGI